MNSSYFCVNILDIFSYMIVALNICGFHLQNILYIMQFY